MTNHHGTAHPSSALVHIVGALVVILVALSLSACGDDKKPNNPGVDWDLGEPTTYTVESTEAIIITDTVTGQQFLFPEGAYGELVIRPIVSGPDAPYDGIGFDVEFDEESPLSIIIDSTGCDQIIVMGYGTAPGAYDDIPGPFERWVAMPCIDTLESGLAFQLTLPFETAGRMWANAKLTAAAEGYSKYWISSIPAGSDDATQRVGLELQSKSYVDDVLNQLSPARQTAARAEVDGRLSPHYAWDGFLYSGFWWRSLGSLGRIVRPTIHLTLAANAGNVAHETGHYFTHVLVGDDTWSTLEGQAPLWDNGHGIRDVVGREMMLEDYAYFFEWLTAGSVKSYNLQDPYVIFGGLSPLTEDFPGVEGFTAVALASLTRTTPTTRNLINGDAVDVPVIGLTNAQVFDIIAQGATGVDALQERITTAVGADADKLPAMFQRIGWRYSVKGRLLTPEGQPLAGATVSSVSVVGDHVYRGGSSSIPSASDGRFTIMGEVFPGDSKIRVWDGHDSIDVPISIEWSEPTDETVDLGDLHVNRARDLTPLTHCAIDFSTDANFDLNGYFQYRHERVQFPWAAEGFSSRLAGSFTGSTFTADRDETHGDIHVTIHLVATVDPLSGDLQTLDVTQTRSVHDEYTGDWSETHELSVTGIPFVSYTLYPPNILMECAIYDEQTCQKVTNYTWSGANPEYSASMLSYDCVPDPPDMSTSYFRIYFYNSP